MINNTRKTTKWTINGDNRFWRERKFLGHFGIELYFPSGLDVIGITPKWMNGLYNVKIIRI